jgi:charged multivesicular body protein 4
MHLFARKKKQQDPKTSIMQLKDALDLLDKKEKMLQQYATRQHQLAVENVGKNKKAALVALKRKKMYDNQIDQIRNYQLNIETQLMVIEGASVNYETFNAMRSGAEAIKMIHRDMTVEEVDKIRDEIQEQMEVANEISETISQPVDLGMNMNEEELLKELEELQQEVVDEKMIEIETPTLDIPDAPITKPKRVTMLPRLGLEENEEAELQQLKESMRI